MIRRFSVQVDDPGDLLTITLRGFWDEGVVYAYIVELETAVGDCPAARDATASSSI